MDLISTNITYSDLNLQANLQPFDIVTDVDEAIQRLLLVLSVAKGSRWMRYKFGCLISTYLFDPLDPTTANKIKNEIEDCLADTANDLSDIVISELVVVPDYDNQQYYVNMRVTIPALQQNKPLTFGLRRL